MLAAGSAKANLIEASARRCVFINQVLDPYIKNNDIWKAPTWSNAWVGAQESGTADPGFRSYGGQNSYGVNNYVFRSTTTKFPTAMLSATAIENTSNTLGLVDATYYNTLPAMPNGQFCKLAGYSKSNTSSYMYYWKELGNSELNFSALGAMDPIAAANADVIKKIESRYSGTLNVVRMDTSSKSFPAKALVTDLISKGRDSIWNVTKGDCEL